MTLLQRFSLYSLAVMLLLAGALGFAVSRALSAHILEVYKKDMAQFIQSEGEAHLLPSALRTPVKTDYEYNAFNEALHVLRDTLSFPVTDVYSREGIAIWSSTRSRVGRPEDNQEGFKQALLGRTVVTMMDVAEDDGALRSGRFAEVFIPLREKGTGAVYGVVEVYLNLADLFGVIRKAQVQAWVVVVLAFAILYGVLYKLVADATRLIQCQNEELAEARRTRYTEIIEALVSAIDAKDTHTRGHSVRVAEIARRIGRAMGLSSEDLEHLHYGALLHDVGKIGIRDAVLTKPGRLTSEEMEEMRRHPAIGVNIFKRLQSVPEGVLQAIGGHHERPDRQGYPTGSDAANTHLFARIVAVADCYDAMRSDRPYRKACSVGETLQEISRNAGRQFDPAVVDALFLMVDEIENEVYQNPLPEGLDGRSSAAV